MRSFVVLAVTVAFAIASQVDNHREDDLQDVRYAYQAHDHAPQLTGPVQRRGVNPLAIPGSFYEPPAEFLAEQERKRLDLEMHRAQPAFKRFLQKAPRKLHKILQSTTVGPTFSAICILSIALLSTVSPAHNIVLGLTWQQFNKLSPASSFILGIASTMLFKSIASILKDRVRPEQQSIIAINSIVILNSAILISSFYGLGLDLLKRTSPLSFTFGNFIITYDEFVYGAMMLMMVFMAVPFLTKIQSVLSRSH